MNFFCLLLYHVEVNDDSTPYNTKHKLVCSELLQVIAKYVKEATGVCDK